MAENYLLGKNQILYFYIDNAYFPLACLTSNDFTKTLDLTDGTVTKCNDNPEPIPGRVSYAGSFEGIAIEDDTVRASIEALHDIIDAKEKVYWKLETTKSNSTSWTRYGQAYLNELTETAPAEGELTFNGSLTGVGTFSDTDLVPTTTTTI